MGGKAIDTPYGLFYDSDADLLFVADRALQGVHRYDLKAGEASFMTEAGETRLEMPVMVVGGGGRYYVSDTVLNKVFVFDSKGRVTREIEEWGRPGGMAYSAAQERLYVVDVTEGRIKAFDAEGNFQFFFGNIGVGKGEFNLPSNIWVDRAGKVYVTDSMNFRIQIFDEFGNHVGNIGKLGDSPGAFARPRGVAVDSDGNVYVVDANFDNIQIFNQEGELLLVFGTPGTKAGEFTLPSGIFIDRNDRIYISDSYNKRIQVFQYFKEQ